MESCKRRELLETPNSLVDEKGNQQPSLMEQEK